MAIPYTEYELPLLEALEQLGGVVKTGGVYPIIEKIMADALRQHPREYEKYARGEIIWINKTQWAREYLKRKGQLDGSEHGVWKITEAGKERLRLWRTTGKDPDAGLEKIISIPQEGEGDPEKAFEALEHLHGPILGVKEIPIVYEPINEQGVILLFTALAARLGYIIVAIRPQFPDAQLAKRDQNGRYRDLKAEFEFRSSQFRVHGHDPQKCDLIICWEHDWLEAPIEVIELKKIADALR